MSTVVHRLREDQPTLPMRQGSYIVVCKAGMGMSTGRRVMLRAQRIDRIDEAQDGRAIIWIGRMCYSLAHTLDELLPLLAK